MKEDLYNCRKERELMVKEQIENRGNCNPRVLSAMRKVPRHLFVEDKFVQSAYDDNPLPIGENQTISQPYIVALMTDKLELTEKETVLEIGTGSGYQTAILAELSEHVYSIERFEKLHKKAKHILELLNYNNIILNTGDGTEGLQEFAPFDRIIVTAFAPEIPQTLIDQLKDNGKMVIPVGESFSQTLMLIIKNNGKIEQQSICGCVFVPLVGKYGWK
ncbi:MAG: protein-L-isoaspartate(D-aspartate) O-methyltransferase [Candidatus Firestonebacteria bacterium]